MAPNKWTTRQDTCLDTTKKEYFDQVVSLSQGVINNHFNKLWDMNEKMHKIFFDPPTSDYSTVEAELLAPRLVLNVDSTTNTNEVYYILRWEYLVLWRLSMNLLLMQIKDCQRDNHQSKMGGHFPRRVGASREMLSEGNDCQRNPCRGNRG